MYVRSHITNCRKIPCSNTNVPSFSVICSPVILFHHLMTAFSIDMTILKPYRMKNQLTFPLATAASSNGHLLFPISSSTPPSSSSSSSTKEQGLENSSMVEGNHSPLHILCDVAYQVETNPTAATSSLEEPPAKRLKTMVESPSGDVNANTLNTKQLPSPKISREAVLNMKGGFLMQGSQKAIKSPRLESYKIMWKNADQELRKEILARKLQRGR
jgi:hypothetical protein